MKPNFYIVILLTIFSCTEKIAKPSVPININDTIIKNVKTEIFGDSVIEKQIITFTESDNSLPMDSFYYKLKNGYRLYFDRKKVIEYCDSILKTFGAETLENFNLVSLYSSILSSAKDGMEESIFVSETHHLLTRFRGFIIHPETQHKPVFYFTTHRKSFKREDIQRDFINSNGDTTSLSWVNIWIEDIR